MTRPRISPRARSWKPPRKRRRKGHQAALDAASKPNTRLLLIEEAATNVDAAIKKSSGDLSKDKEAASLKTKLEKIRGEFEDLKGKTGNDPKATLADVKLAKDKLSAAVANVKNRDLSGAFKFSDNMRKYTDAFKGLNIGGSD